MFTSIRIRKGVSIILNDFLLFSWNLYLVNMSDYLKELERDAKADGRLIIYASLRGVLQNSVKAFRKKYEHLNLHVEYISSHPVPIERRIEVEAEAFKDLNEEGDPGTADVVIMPQFMLIQMTNKGLLRECIPEIKRTHLKLWPNVIKDENATWAAMAVEPTGVVYNDALFKKLYADKGGLDYLPTTFEEYTDPKWSEANGKKVIAGKTIESSHCIQSLVRFPEGKMGFYYLIALKEHIGESRWTELMKRMANNVKPRTYECLLHMTHNLGLGQHVFGLPATLRKQGMGDDYSYMREGGLKPLVLTDIPPSAIARCAGLTAAGKNKSAGELFLNFIFSADWQDELGRTLDGMVPARPGTVTEYWVSQALDKGFIHYPKPEHVAKEKEYIEEFESLGLGSNLPKGTG